MQSEYLNVRLSEDDQRVISALQKSTGLTPSAIVKRAIRKFAEVQAGMSDDGGLFALGVGKFGRTGNARRQSAEIKQVVQAEVHAKRARR